MLDQDVHMDIRAHLFNYRIATTMQPKEKEAPQEMSTCLWNQRAKQELHIYLIIGLRQAYNLR